MADITTKSDKPPSAEETGVRSAAFSPVDTGGRPIQTDRSADADDLQRRREELGDIAETKGGQSSAVGAPYDGKGEVQRGQRDEIHVRPGKK